ncbi:hypothetical protein DB324_01035 [Limosilactobacillus reuteri]|uniref:hypothetical protein n=1 Tax=Limosilactobacillus reuteri TaxID=1598 RepID=UPI000D387C1D|nr:hypothetical protein [Limosilactobacillus reuteri]MDW5473253.1 hypothetical protein [Limosilactobacillus reuteri]PUH36133.1 hypothetical protein DB324_01035 [Limosilactobacillus reuteri]PUH36394.1 hypothetical protein DB323_00800 [Limosilactobacillus reuteri]WLC96581.1 hypothetical protein LDE72_04245 [Limosilactobacillus reuteri]WRH78751.1 hypothetical protein QM199_02650 [Limosilactobacillus reuteri]
MNNGVANYITHIKYCIVYVVCTDVQSALRKGSTTTIQKEVSEEALGGNQMTLKKIVNSKIIAMLLGVWIAYCAGAGDYDGVLVLLFTYLLLLLDFATGAGDTDGKIQ